MSARAAVGTRGVRATTSRDLLQAVQDHQPDRGLNRVEATVVAPLQGVVARLQPVIPQATQALREPGVVGRDHAAVAGHVQVLERVEAEAARDRQRTRSDDTRRRPPRPGPRPRPRAASALQRRPGTRPCRPSPPSGDPERSPRSAASRRAERPRGRADSRGRRRQTRALHPLRRSTRRSPRSCSVR